MNCDLLLLDAKFLLFKAAYAFNSLTTEWEGSTVRTGGVYGFLRQILKIHETYGGSMVVVWDSIHNIRRQTLPTYKGHKPSAQYDELTASVHEQEPIAIRLLSYLGIRQASADGYEADDVLYTLAKRYSEVGFNVVIYTGDEDLLQAVGPNRTVVLSKRKTDDECVNEQRLMDLKGLTPSQFSDAKCLSGCTSDNVPGVPGIGKTYATKIIQAFGNLNNVLNSLDVDSAQWDGIASRLRLAIREHKDQVVRNLKLIRLFDCNDNMKFMVSVRDLEKSQEMLQVLDFKTMLSPSNFEKLLSLGVARDGEIVCPRGAKHYTRNQIQEMCTYYLTRDISAVLGNEYCHNSCPTPQLIGIRVQYENSMEATHA